MQTKQKNLRLDVDVIEFIESGATADGRNDGNYLSRLIRTKLMPKAKPKQSTAIAAPYESWPMPMGLNPAAWMEFEQHRKDIKKPMTDTARTKAAKQICQLTHAEQQATIDKSIQSRWAGLFPEKIKSTKSFIEQQNDATFEKIFGKKRDDNVIEGECNAG